MVLRNCPHLTTAQSSPSGPLKLNTRENMIRTAASEDIPSILVMGRKFFDLAGWPEIAEWDVGSVMAMLEQLIDSPDGILLVIDDDGVCGMAGALLYPFYFNTAHKTGQELFWWVEPEARGRDAILLLDKLENTARQGGAMSFTMISVDRLRSGSLARLYRRRGYRAAENTWIKRL